MAKVHNSEHYVAVAERHLRRVQTAWRSPTDWTELTTFGLYCIEALIQAAATKARLPIVRTHWGKADLARDLHTNHGLTDVSSLMADLNEGRKAHAYGDTDFEESEYDAEDIAAEIESFFDEVKMYVTTDEDS